MVDASLSEIKEQSKVLLRVDYNMPRVNGKWLVNERLTQTLPIINQCLKKQCSILLVSHLGRPEPGFYQAEYSFKTLVPILAQTLQRPVRLLPDWPNRSPDLMPGEVGLAENTRFLKGETSNSTDLSKAMVANIDVVIMDAFACAHRSHASTVGMMRQAKQVLLGTNHQAEIEAIQSITHQTGQNRLALIGGKKLSTKLPLLRQLLKFFPTLCVGGGLANTLLYAQGYPLGCSWIEYDHLKQAEAFLKLAGQHDCRVYVPKDVVVSQGSPKPGADIRTVPINAIQPNECIVDIGPDSVAEYKNVINQQSYSYWNGPMGIYELDFGKRASIQLAKQLSGGRALVGGGDTLSCIKAMPDLTFTHKSTGGGSFLHLLANQTSPVLEAYRASIRETISQ